MSANFRLPGDDERIVIIGKTGSGKTVAALYHLSRKDFDIRPWVIIDYKGDKNIAKIDGLQDITYEDIPDYPGIYRLEVMPGEKELVSDWFRRVWETEGIGIYVDEGYMVDPRDKWFNSCLTQGRSKNIPMIVLTQRPRWMSRFVFSESEFIQMFSLNARDDIDTVQKFIKTDDSDKLTQKLPKFFSWYYDVGNDELRRMKPVPNVNQLLADIESKMPKRKRRPL